MMPPTEWKDEIAKVIRKISDKNYQMISWFNSGNEGSSPDEFICQVFYDLLIEKFLSDTNVELTDSARNSLRVLVQEMNEFVESTPNQLDPRKVVNDLRWIRIRHLAQQANDLIF